MAENPIQLVDIQAELRALWNKEQGEKKIHASLFNLLLYVPKSKRTEYFQDVVKSVLSKFPCRIILISVDDMCSQEYLKTGVRSETIGEGEKKIFCELITIDVAGPLIERVPFIILPLLLPDLPIYLLWTEDPCLETEILPSLGSIAQRIIFDSDGARNLQLFSQAALSIIHAFQCEIGDLNWSAIGGWRYLFNQTFGNLESFYYLAQTKTMRIYFNRMQKSYLRHPEVEAAFFQAWIASRLNWKFQELEQSEGHYRVTYKRPTGPVSFILTPQEDLSVAPGAILGIELESLKDGAQFTFKRKPKTRQVFIQYADKDRCDLPRCQFLRGSNEGREIVDEIFYPSAKEHYRSMLEVLVNIPWT